MTDRELAASAARVDAVMTDLHQYLAHAFEVVSTGPPAFTARCTCAWWHLAWDADELTRRGFGTIEDAERAARLEHAAHARARADIEARAARGPDFYG